MSGLCQPLPLTQSVSAIFYHQYILDNLLLRLMSCDRLLDVPRIGKFSYFLCCHITYHIELNIHIIKIVCINLVYSEDLCKEQMRLYMVGIGPWIRFPDTLHELLAHLPAVLGMYEYFLRLIIIYLLNFGKAEIFLNSSEEEILAFSSTLILF